MRRFNKFEEGVEEEAAALGETIIKVRGRECSG
mgnify:CR=1 FL=1